MMRTIEVLIVIIIITGAFIAASFFAVLPWPRQVSPVNLRRLAFTTLQMLDSNYELSRAAFETDNYTIWGGLQIALSAALPPNVIYNLTVYEVTGETTQLYTVIDSMSNAESLGATSDASTYLVASSNVTFNVVPEKIGEHGGGGGTLYILNCSDANGWWITGYTAPSLAEDLYKLLSPYFIDTIMVQDTAQLERILNNNTLQGETVQNAVIINTFGEAIPIPTAYCTSHSTDSYASYCHFLGQRVRLYNWTWTSIVGYPFYYVSNTGYFTGSSDHNGWGIYGMKRVGRTSDGNGGRSGLNSFLRGINNQAYSYSNTNLAYDVGEVHLTQNVENYCNEYGIYPSSSQTSTRALTDDIVDDYNLEVGLSIFEKKSGCYPGALFQHVEGGDITGSLLAIGLTRTPDIRITALSLLSYYQPRLIRSQYNASDTSRLVVLQLGLVGGV